MDSGRLIINAAKCGEGRDGGRERGAQIDLEWVYFELKLTSGGRIIHFLISGGVTEGEDGQTVGNNAYTAAATVGEGRH